MQCPHCGISSPPGSRRCGKCGTILLPSPDAERKLVTVLFADLVAHTELATRTDPEDWRGLLEAYFAEMVQPIQRYGGIVEKFIGDAIFAVFGVPQAHEDDAARAVRAAVEMHTAFERLKPILARQTGLAPAMRIGVATGEVIAPVDPKRDPLVTGALTTLAERLQKESPPNGVVLSERTYRFVASIVEAEDLGALALKGFPDGQVAFLIRGFRPSVGRLSPPRTALVGRKRELTALRKARDELLEGQGQAVAVIGEAGIGKSRLVAEFRENLPPSITVVEARGNEFALGTPYATVKQLLSSYFGFGDTDPQEVVRRRLGAGLRLLFGRLAPNLREIFEHLQAPGASTSFASRIQKLTSDEIRQLVVRAFVDLWEAVAKGRPLILIVDDLQWADSASAAVLSELVQVARRVPLLLLCSFRLVGQSAAWRDKIAASEARSGRYKEIILGGLSESKTRHLASILLRNLGMPIELNAVVAQQAEGIPFYVEQLVQSLRQYGPNAALPSHVPDTLQGVLQARLDGIPRPARRVLQAASVIGRSFPVKLLQMLTGVDGELAARLSELEKHEFVHQVQRLPEVEFAFRHVLLREAAYRTLLRAERRELHARLAVALEREWAGEDVFPLLAHHFIQGEVWDRGFFYAAKAGDAAKSLSALEDALTHYDLAVQIEMSHPESVVDRSALFVVELTRADVLSILGRSNEAQGYLEWLLGKYRRSKLRGRIYRHIALSTLRSSGDLRAGLRNLNRAHRFLKSSPDPAEEADICRLRAWVKERQRDYGDALKYALRGLKIAEESGLQRILLEICRVLMGIHFYGGDFAQSKHYASENVRLAREFGSQLDVMQARNNLVYLLLFQGQIQEAMEHAREAVAFATQFKLHAPLIRYLDGMARIFLEQGRWQDAGEVLASAQDLVQRHSLGPALRADVEREMGFVSLLGEAWNEAIQHLERAKSLDTSIGSALNLPRIHRGLSEAYLGLRNFSTASLHAAKVKRFERGHNPIETPAALRVLAVVAREKGNHRRAIKLLEESLSLMASRKASGEYGGVLLDLALTYAPDARRKSDAGDAVAKSMQIFSALQAFPFLERAKEIVSQL